MIPLGQKVAVVASSNNKSGTNVRRGSVGYIVKVYKAAKIDKLKAIAAFARITFTRYGYSNKERCETKLVILLFPIIFANVVDKPKKYLNELTKRGLDFRGNNGFFKYLTVNGEIPKDKTDIVVVTPIESDTQSSLNEFKAWFISKIDTRAFREAITRLRVQPKHVLFDDLFQNKMPNIKSVMSQSLKSKKTALLFAGTIYKNIDQFEPLLETIRIKACLEQMRLLEELERSISGVWGRRQNGQKISWCMHISNFKFSTPQNQEWLEHDLNTRRWVKTLRDLSKTIY